MVDETNDSTFNPRKGVKKLAEKMRKQPNAQRDHIGRFLPGNTMGRVPANPYRKLMKTIPLEEFAKIKDAILKKAKEGDLEAAKFLYGYVAPPLLDIEPVNDIKVDTMNDINHSMGIVIQARSEGDLSGSGAKDYLDALKIKQDAIEKVDLETKVNQLVQRVQNAGK